MNHPLPPLLAFGAHPDDIEFGAGGVIASEALAGRRVHLVVCSRGEAGTHGTPAVRTREARRAAKILGATMEFITLDGDAHLEVKARHALKLAAIIRRIRPEVVLAPTLERNQHPDHWRLGELVRDASRLARYGGLRELKRQPRHAIGQLFFYAIGPGAELPGAGAIIVDISRPAVMAAWKAAMQAHASQMQTLNYLELQLARARMHGLNAGVENAQLVWPNDPPVVTTLTPLARAARRF
jgi:LmbE family N-acetylglucosaminyl deacetylase